MKISLGAVVVVAYFVGGFGTFGWTWNHSRGVDRCYVDNSVQHDCFTDETNHVWGAVVAGLAWPIYLGGLIAIKATAA